ncbi:MAG: aminotransferase class V-fold PLP-dependent enzyme, partial [Chloroflexi bacterium]
MDKIYLDYAATTPVDARVLAAMTPYFGDFFGNPSSVHRYGQQAEAALDSSRETVAAALNCRPDEVVFTSCGSESDNLALRGAALGLRLRSAGQKNGAKWIITSKAEHPAVSKTARQLAEVFGFEVEWLGLDEFGMVT